MSDQEEGAALAAPVAVPPAAPKFLDERKRFRVVPLQWPIEYDGTVWSEITVRRLTAAEVAAFIEAEDKKLPPMFDAPAIVIDNLDDDDAVEVNKAVADFLPRRWRTDQPEPASAETTSR